MADVSKIIERIRANGANVAFEGGRLRVVNGDKLPAGALDFIKAHGRAIADWLDREAEVEERAAIMEHDGGLPRNLADHCAKAMIAGLPRGLPEVDRSFYMTAIGRIADEVFRPAHEQARAA